MPMAMPMGACTVVNTIIEREDVIRMCPRERGLQ